jgi:hypothetical protein
MFEMFASLSIGIALLGIGIMEGEHNRNIQSIVDGVIGIVWLGTGIVLFVKTF